MIKTSAFETQQKKRNVSVFSSVFEFQYVYLRGNTCWIQKKKKGAPPITSHPPEINVNQQVDSLTSRQPKIFKESRSKDIFEILGFPPFHFDACRKNRNS